MLQKKIYLDNSATTAVYPEVIDVMQKYFSKIYGNASSLHNFGKQAKIVLNNARDIIASKLNADPEEIFFTSCGTESDNIAISGILNAYKQRGHIITSSIEHHAVFYLCKHLEKNGYRVTYLGVNKDGIVSIEDFKKSVKDDTLLVTIMHANNEIGAIQPIETIANELRKINKTRKNKIYFHTDAVQTIGKLQLDVKKLNVDLLAMSAHKFNGPKGIGGLYVKKGTHISPITFGGHQENGLRPGTENIPAIIGFAKAFEISNTKIEEKNRHIFNLKEKLKKGILDTIPNIIINGSGNKSVSNILNVSFSCVEAEALLFMLDRHGIAVSTGSACASGSSGPSHVLSALHVDPIIARGAIRFSFGCYNTETEVDYVLTILPDVIKKLRLISPI
ncbi:MAG: cysteine desulfurase [Endomicrobium sp.]|jgi:cysteine desulfurase|nr:cysteine desulfurase [Endomicrobium sp.]